MLDRDRYRALCDARIFEPASLQRALRDRLVLRQATPGDDDAIAVSKVLRTHWTSTAS